MNNIFKKQTTNFQENAKIRIFRCLMYGNIPNWILLLECVLQNLVVCLGWYDAHVDGSPYLDHRTFPEAVVSTGCSSCTLYPSTQRCTIHRELHVGLKVLTVETGGLNCTTAHWGPRQFNARQSRQSIAELRIAGYTVGLQLRRGGEGVL